MVPQPLEQSEFHAYQHRVITKHSTSPRGAGFLIPVQPMRKRRESCLTHLSSAAVNSRTGLQAQPLRPSQHWVLLIAPRHAPVSAPGFPPSRFPCPHTYSQACFSEQSCYPNPKPPSTQWASPPKCPRVPTNKSMKNPLPGPGEQLGGECLSPGLIPFVALCATSPGHGHKSGGVSQWSVGVTVLSSSSPLPRAV